MIDPQDERWSLLLYINGASPQSLKAIDTVRRLCDEELSGRVTLDVVEALDQPELLIRDQILAIPTLIRRYPEPIRRIVGGDYEIDRLRLRLGIPPVEILAGENAEP